MPQSEQLFISLLTFLASTTGSGGVTNWLFDWLKAKWPMHDGAGPLVRWMHTPRYARILAILLAMAISVLCTAALAALTGADIWNAIDLVVAPAFSALFSQLLHARQLPGTPTYPEPTLNGQVLATWHPQTKEEAEDDYRRDIADAQQRYQDRLLEIHQQNQPPGEDET